MVFVRSVVLFDSSTGRSVADAGFADADLDGLAHNDSTATMMAMPLTVSLVVVSYRVVSCRVA